MKIKLILNKKGFSLVELLIAIGMFGTVAVSIVFFATDAVRFTSATEKSVIASLKLQEVTNAIVLNKNDLWSSMVVNTDNGTKRIVFQDNKYEIQDGQDVLDDITIDVYINSVMRDSNLNIVTSGGFTDPETREIQIDISWIDPITGNESISNSFYVNNWNTPRLRQTTETDFQSGTLENTIVTSTGDGAVEMNIASDVNGDWCEPSLTLTEFDLPGQGVANAITAVPGFISVGTGENASGLSYIDVTFQETNPPTLNVDGTFDGPKTNDVYGGADYAYLGTDTNNSEVYILDITGSGTNPVQSGYYDAPGNLDADAVYADGDYGYVGAGSTLYIFDISSKIGSRPTVGSVGLSGVVTDIFVSNGYAYLAINNGAKQVEIIDVSTPSSPSIIADVQANALAGVGIDIDEARDRLYLVTQSSTTQDEMFIVDITTMSGTQTIVSSYNISDDMDPTGIRVPVDNRAIVVGENGTQQYQVVDIETETSPVLCGGLTISTGIKGIDSLTDVSGDAWSYITTGDSSAELKIIEGGPGGGGGNGQGSGYPDTGTYESIVFDTNSTTSNYYSIDWMESIPIDTDMYLQLRTGTTADLSAETWIGPDGTNSTYFTNPLGESLPASLNNKRYIQYKIYFDSPDRINTPIFEEINIYYER